MPIQTSKLLIYWRCALLHVSEITPFALVVPLSFPFFDQLWRSLTEDSLLNARTVQASGNVPSSSFQICMCCGFMLSLRTNLAGTCLYVFFLRRKMFWNSTATWYQSCQKDSRGKDSWNFSPDMILHLISRGQHCLSQLDATYTCPNFGEYCSVIDRLRGTLLKIVEKVSCIWCSFCIVATPTLSGVPSLVVLPSEFPVEWLGILWTKPLLPSSNGTHPHTAQHSELILKDSFTLWLIDWNLFQSLALRFSTGCKKKPQFVWWYVFSRAFRSSGSWQVDSTSWVCWSRTVKHFSVFLGLRSRCRTFKKTSWSLKHLARAVVSHNFETHFAWSAFKTLGIMHFLQYYQTPFGLAVLQDGRADFQTGQQAFMGHLITLWLIPNRNCGVFSRKPWRSASDLCYRLVSSRPCGLRLRNSLWCKGLILRLKAFLLARCSHPKPPWKMRLRPWVLEWLQLSRVIWHGP